MKKIFLTLRYYLEIIALPAFIYLVIHLSGHGVMVLLEGDEHQHSAEAAEQEEYLEENHDTFEYAKEACEEAGGNWLAEFLECEYVSAEFCTETLNGSFESCASACRHDEEALICTKQCVPVCQLFEENRAEPLKKTVNPPTAREQFMVQCEGDGNSIRGSGVRDFLACMGVSEEFCTETLEGRFDSCADRCASPDADENCLEQCEDSCVYTSTESNIQGEQEISEAEDSHDEEAHAEYTKSMPKIVSAFFTVEVLSGILLLILFSWLWHRPALRRWVPCTHEHCHTESHAAHLLAVIAFCVHLFPEAGVRSVLFEEAFGGEVLHAFAILAFVAHFLVDVLVVGMLASYFSGAGQKALSILLIVTVWLLTFFTGEHIMNFVPLVAEGILFLVSAFLLSMFVHFPHRPVVECTDCRH